MSETPSTAGPAETGEVVELRVHGVSGAGPEQVLDRPHAYQVAGDSNGGFFRPRPGYPDSCGPGGVTVEAYRWSDLPSGTAVRTLSLVFLLPFMLCNVAAWMRPNPTGSHTMMKVLCRILGLTLTALYVLSIVGAALDLVAWQCMASPRCVRDRDWLSWLGTQPTGLRLAVLSLIPIGAIALIWWLSARPGRPFSAFHAPKTTGSGPYQLAAVGRWDSAPLVGRLRSIHVATAFATLDASLLAARLSPGVSVVTLVLGVLVGAVLAACIALICARNLIDHPEPRPTADAVTRMLRTFTCGLTVLVVLVVLLDPAPWPPGIGLPRYGAFLAWVFVAQTLLLAGIGLVVLRHRGLRSRRRGWGAPAIAAVATGLAVAFSSELVYRIADLLNREEPTAARAVISPPPAYKWAIFGFVLAVLGALVVAGLVTVVSARGRYRAAADIVARDFPDAPPKAAPRLRQVERTIARARFTEHLEPITMVYACLIGLGLATSALGLMGRFPADVIQGYIGIPGDLVNFFLGVGSYVIAAILLGLVVGGIFAYRTVEFRRYVGVIWDLGTFWPRGTHPFAPPCYAERAVPELTQRITYLVGQGNRVLLSGHSHGSVLLAAAVLQLPERVGSRVALLTYGSPLRRLYGPLFPAYVDESVLREVGRRVGWRWINIWRDTDQIGSWIFSPNRPGDPTRPDDPAATVDRRQIDPRDVVPPPSDSVPPPIFGHWPGESDDRLTESVRELAERLRTETS
ncbi:hypothetical protein [Micromonospora avicenniae]|uniref:Integral membrane protein n=1 Tax=Micromonospora avicenniae TaxID=1198245 RepID=A0A1N7E3J5_9ACTN|nr:hypothetical protein [Micromonospora avicenniae]SIR82611.1 hypothetical protein SAMN05444858_12050 [Micromonospora avicenniae]